MSKDHIEVAAVAQPALQDFTNCPDWGKGGRFIYDPISQTRTRIGDEPAPAAEPQQEAPATETMTTVKKERSRG